jgi:putative PIN family toxin of toxin-antitoxin system
VVLYIIPHVTFKIVIDTNVFVSALRSKLGASFKLISMVGETRAFEIAVSVPLVLEYEDAANRQTEISGLSSGDIADIIDYFCRSADRRQIYFLWRPFLRDPADDMILELAVEAQCDFIITFNKRDYTGCEQFGLKILTPHEFLRMIGE